MAGQATRRESAQRADGRGLAAAKGGRGLKAVGAQVLLAGVLVGGVAASGVSAANAEGPPEGRAYERVSPADRPSGAYAGVSSSELMPLPGRAFDEGEGIAYGASSAIGENWSGPPNTLIFGRRTASGWTAESPVRSIDDGNTPLELSNHEPRSSWIAADGRSLTYGLAKPLTLTATNGLGGIFRSGSGGGAPDWLSRPADPLPTVAGVAQLMVVGSSDGRTVAFQSSAPLTADAPASGIRAVYAHRDGVLKLVSRLPNDSVPITSSFFPNTGDASGSNASNPPTPISRNQVAGDGRYVLFTNGGDANQGVLYVRDLDLGTTKQLTGIPGTPPLVFQLSEGWGVGGSTASFDNQTLPKGAVFAASDAPRAFFHGNEGVGVTQFVQEANLASGVVTPRPAITGPPVGLSPDGRRMLFLELPSGAVGSSPPGAYKLRYWDEANDSSSTVVGTITTAAATGPSSTTGIMRVFGSSPDGKTWVFASVGSVDPARPNMTPTTRQLYRWTVGEAAPTCLSCEPVDGVARTTGVNMSVQDSISSEAFFAPATALLNTNNLGKTTLGQPGHVMSDDGRWILFDSPDQLVDEDQNTVRDVYLWDRDADDGEQLQLVTSGTGTSPSYALDISPDGINAFFSTREALLDEDNDGAYDVYTARIGGGFAPPVSPCAGEDCRTPNIPDPPSGSIGSNVLTPPPSGGKQPVQKGSPKLRVRSVRTSPTRLTVRIDTPKAGKIRISGSRVRTTKRTAKRATTYTLRVPLSSATRKSIARGKTVKVSLRVQFTPTGSKKASRVNTSVSVRKGR